MNTPRLAETVTRVVARGRLMDLIKCKPGHEGVIDALLGQVLVLDTLEHALAYYRRASDDNSLSPNALLCTLDGAVVDGHGSLTGGALSKNSQGASVLAHKREIKKLDEATTVKGTTLIPLAIYFKDGRAKVEIGVARGKQQHDKRDAIRKKEQDREIRRAMSHRR